MFAFVAKKWNSGKPLFILVMGRTPFYRTSNELEYHFSKIERTQTCSSIGDRTRTTYFWLRTSNFEPNRAFARFTKSLFELTRTSLIRTSNQFERVHLLVMKLGHPIFGFKRLTIELRTLFDPSLYRILPLMSTWWALNQGLLDVDDCSLDL